jgi:hypothetical protein
VPVHAARAIGPRHEIRALARTALGCIHVSLITTQAQPFTAGKYLITPLSRAGENGRYSATVSIRSGEGSGTSDRIYTFEADFGTREDALLHAAAQGRLWLSHPRAFA